MHELALGRSLIEMLEEEAAVHRFRRVRRVTVSLGPFAHVDPEAFRFCFDVVAQGSLADGAELILVQPAGEALCRACGRRTEVKSRLDACPACQCSGLLVTEGDEMRLRELEVD